MWEHDARLDAKPDYGTLGLSPDANSNGPITVPQRGLQAPWAVLAGVLAALAVVSVNSGVARAGWQKLEHYLSLQGKAVPASPGILSQRETESLAQKDAQHQATLLLERAINRYEGANEQIAERVEGWRGHLTLDPQLNSLITTGMNSNDLRVRAAAIEVDLAALNVAKTAESVERLEQQAESGTQQERVWAIWTLGLLGNRGVEPQRVHQVLSAGLRDSNVEIRQWAVEGFSYLGTDDALQPLLKEMHDDPSPAVRERAACGLAQSGMFNEQQRNSVVPELLNYAEDGSLDQATHAWTYHALRDITGQSLPDNAAAWRGWYEASGN
ncbi:MAG TPA: HEAT repeat domain-containing protein [Terriglobales bacterium]|nr:HEAT repeat domain-containing protein [Terriglobales bacterium]